MVTSSVRASRHLVLGYASSPRVRDRLRSLAGSWADVRDLPPAYGPDGACLRPLLAWDGSEHRPYLRRCCSPKSAVCRPCAATRKRAVQRIAHLGTLDRLAAGGHLALLTLTGPGDPGHLRWSVTGPSADRPVCGCEDSAPHGFGVWNRGCSERWNHLRTLLAREYPGFQFYRAVEPQQRGVLHLHVIVWSPAPFDLEHLQELALRAGFGCNTRLDVCKGPADAGRFARYVTKYVTKAVDDRAALPWESFEHDTGELVGSPATYRPWSQSKGFGVRMKTHLDAIAAQRRAHAKALRRNVSNALTVLGGTILEADPTLRLAET